MLMFDILIVYFPEIHFILYFVVIDVDYDSESSEGSGADESQESDGNNDSDDGDSFEESEADEDDDDDDDGDVEGQEPIYPGASITLHESLLAIFTVMSNCHLPGNVVAHILKLIALHCPDNSRVKKTLYTFKKYFAKIGQTLMVFHYFCADCIYPLQSKLSECQKCRKRDNASYFLELPLLNQLQNLFKRDKFYENLQFRFKPDRKRCSENIEDIYDGRVYKEEVEKGFLSDPSNISFMWYSDGVSIFKSSSFSIWPLCLVVNELPYKLRTLPENILLVGLWFGKHKPNPNIFLRPLHKTMNNFEKNGLTFKLPDNSTILVKGKVICGTCDLPAKSKFLQFKQFNSYYGCPKCLSEGARAPTGKTTVQVYPFTPNIEKRTHQETVQTARLALEARRTNKDASILGIKGPTLLAKIVPDLIRCTAIDIMHGVALGLCKLLLHLWFASKFSNMEWSVHHLFDLADEKLRKFKAPSFSQRAPRSLKEMKFWKASEYKMFLMYYSVPIMKNILDEVYLKHHCLLVSALSLLSQDSISLSQVQAASAMLQSYVSDFPRLYHIRYLGINVHQLIHLPDEVINLGPLWVYSCFFLENFNGKINKFFHGTQCVALQICSAASMFMQIPIFKRRLQPDSQISNFLSSVENSSKPFRIADVIDNSTYAVGSYSYEYETVRASALTVRNFLNAQQGSCAVFYRLKKHGVMYFSAEYGRSSNRRESSYVLFENDNSPKLGQVLRFAKWSECRDICDIGCQDCPSTYLAIIKIFNRQHWFLHDMGHVRLPYMAKCVPTNEVIAVGVQSIKHLCFFMEANDEMYIAYPVNRLEVE